MKNIIQSHVLALPLLNILRSSHMFTASQLREAIAKEFNLNSKALSQAPDLQHIIFNNQFNNQIDLVLLFLFNSGLIECQHEATYTLSEAGKQLLAKSPSDQELHDEISAKLKNIPSEKFKEFIISLGKLSIDSAQKIADQIPMDDDPEISDLQNKLIPKFSTH